MIWADDWLSQAEQQVCDAYSSHVWPRPVRVLRWLISKVERWL